MSANDYYLEHLKLRTPHTLNALTKLVMAMASVKRNKNKKTWFGRDKGVISYQKFMKTLDLTIHSMVLDRLIKENDSAEKVIEKLLKSLQYFSMVYPNWQDAYGYADVFFNGKRDEALVVIDRIRNNQ